MSIVVDLPANRLIPGCIVVGSRGLGVLGSVIPTGVIGRGEALAAGQLDAGDGTKEIRIQRTSSNAGITIDTDESTAARIQITADGVYDLIHDLYADGVKVGSYTYEVQVGQGGTVVDVIASVTGLRRSRRVGDVTASVVNPSQPVDATGSITGVRRLRRVGSVNARVSNPEIVSGASSGVGFSAKGKMITIIDADKIIINGKLAVVIWGNGGKGSIIYVGGKIAIVN